MFSFFIPSSVECFLFHEKSFSSLLYKIKALSLKPNEPKNNISFLFLYLFGEETKLVFCTAFLK